MLQALTIFALMLLCRYTLAQTPTLTGKAVFQYNEPLVVNWEFATHEDDDEIFFYNVNDISNKVFRDTADDVTSGNVSFTGVGLGNYVFAYSRYANAATPLATFNFSVIANISISAPDTVVTGQQIVVNFTTSAWHTTSDYIGLYDPSKQDSFATGYLQYKYVPAGATGNVTFDGYTSTNPYLQVVYVYKGNESTTYANREYVQYLSGITIAARKNDFALFDDIVIDYTTPVTHGTSDYIYLFKGNYSTVNVTGTSVMKSTVIPAGTSGSVTFKPDDKGFERGVYTVLYKIGDTTNVANNTFQMSVLGGNANSLAPSSFLLFVSVFLFVAQYFM